MPPPPTSDDAALSRWIESDEASPWCQVSSLANPRCSAGLAPSTASASRRSRRRSGSAHCEADHHGARRLRARSIAHRAQAPRANRPRARAPDSACRNRRTAIHHEVGAAVNALLGSPAWAAGVTEWVCAKWALSGWRRLAMTTPPSSSTTIQALRFRRSTSPIGWSQLSCHHETPSSLILLDRPGLFVL